MLLTMVKNLMKIWAPEIIMPMMRSTTTKSQCIGALTSMRRKAPDTGIATMKETGMVKYPTAGLVQQQVQPTISNTEGVAEVEAEEQASISHSTRTNTWAFIHLRKEQQFTKKTGLTIRSKQNTQAMQTMIITMMNKRRGRSTTRSGWICDSKETILESLSENQTLDINKQSQAERKRQMKSIGMMPETQEKRNTIYQNMIMIKSCSWGDIEEGLELIQKAAEEEENEEAISHVEEVLFIQVPPRNINMAMAEVELPMAHRLRLINSSRRRRIHNNITNRQGPTPKMLTWKKRKLVIEDESQAESITTITIRTQKWSIFKSLRSQG